MATNKKSDNNDTVPAKWRFIAGLVLVPILMAATILSVWFAPPDIPVWKIYIVVVLLAILAGVAAGIGIDGGLKLHYTSTLGPARLTFDAIGGLALTALILVFFTQYILPAVLPYRLHVYPVDEHDKSVDETEISTQGVDAFKYPFEHGWLIMIPASNRPPTGKFTLITTAPKRFLYGSMEVSIDNNLDQTVKPKMVRDRSGVITGTVVEEKTLRPISGATVSVEGSENNSTTTDANGRFVIATNGGDGESVYVQAAKDGYMAQEVVEASDRLLQIRLPKAKPR